MSNRRFEMYEIRQVIQRLLRARSDRDVACAQRVGRKTVARVRRQAFERGWLDTRRPQSSWKWRHVAHLASFPS